MNKYMASLLYVLAGAFAIRVILALMGLTDAIYADWPYLPAPTYLAPVMAHTLYGILCFALVIIAGSGCLAMCQKYTTIGIDDLTILSLPIGLLACLILSLLSLQGIHGQVVAGLALAVALVKLRGRFAHTGNIPLNASLFIVLLAVAFGSHLAFMWRPATLDYAGAIDIGDLTTYMGWYYSLSESVYPFYNLGVEGELHLGYFNHLQTFYALALDFLPLFDIYLFLTASLGTFYILSIAWMLRALCAFRTHAGLKELSLRDALLVCGLFLAAARYPSWVVESPPVVFMVPIALSVAYAVARSKCNALHSGLTFILAVVGSALSKVVSVVVLGSYAGLKFLQDVLRRPKPAHLFFFGLVALAAAAYVSYMVGQFLGVFLPEWNPGPESWHRLQAKGWDRFYRVIPTALKDLGLLLIVLGVFKLRDYGLLIAATFGTACHFLFPFLFTPTPPVLLVLIAGYVLVTEETPKSVKRLLLTGAILFLPHHWKRDYGTFHMLLLWVITLGPAVLLSLHNRVASSPRDTGHTKAWRALPLITAASLLVLSLVAVADGSLRLGKKRHKVVSASLYEIWLKTRQLTPANALIFTDQTGNEPDRLTGWNDYSLMAKRQFYLSSWSSSKLRYDAPRRRERLEDNDAVISGALSPTDLALTRTYSSYYAVVANEISVPSSFRSIYRNDDYGLYEIPVDADNAPASRR